MRTYDDFFGRIRSTILEPFTKTITNMVNLKISYDKRYWFRPAMTPPSISHIAPVTQLALSLNRKSIV